MARRRAVLGTAAGALAALAGCSVDRTPSGTDSPATPADGQVPTGTTPESGRRAGYTHVRPSGNRVLAGSGSLPEDDPPVYEADEQVTWVVGVPTDAGSDWLVATADGRIDRVAVADGAVVETDRGGSLPGLTPPAGRVVDGRVTPLDPPPETSALSHPVVVEGGRVLFVTDGGDLRLAGTPDDDADVDATPVASVGVDALPDARIVRVAPGRYALLAGRTRRYAHGALGDETEAERVVLADVRDGLDVETLVDPDPVVEGTAPLAADVTGDGTRDVVVTLSDGRSGARLAAVGLDGERIATGPGFPTGNRWRHQLCVAPFGPAGEVELAAVETPHIGGTARFHRRDGDEFSVVASRRGVSSHAYGSRNLDGALAGDFDGDGAVELLVPTDARDELLALRRTDGGVETAWRLAVGGELVSNLAGVSGPDGSLAVAAAGADGTTRVWGA